MTDQELIAALRWNMMETGSIICLGCGHERGCSTHGCAVLREAAERIERLGEQQDDNPPLTLDELRDLAGKEAVYAVSSADKGHWCVIDTAPRFGGGTAIIAIYGRGLTLGGDDYGTLWLAYRRKPEEETT